MKKTFLVLTLACCALSLWAKPVEINKAKSIAKAFVEQKVQRTGAQRIPQRIEIREVPKASQDDYFYTFNTSNGGFVIVSANDVAYPILGYSTTDTINYQEIPDNVQYWLDTYAQDIQMAIDSNWTQSAEVAELWQNVSLYADYDVVVEPLITTQWNQAPLYNKFCPFDTDNNELTVTGCVATAMAQVINYWGSPAKGYGYHSYDHSKYGTLFADFTNTTYDYATMPVKLEEGVSTTEQIDAVATLMYHCGVSVNMNYNVASAGGSGAYNNAIGTALKINWGYDRNIRTINKSSGNYGNYGAYAWRDTIKSELDAGRPILYSGQSASGGHSFICDGYAANNYFHINWGWGGLFDGYFQLEALAPGEGGIGANGGAYNESQSAIIGIQPATYPSFSDATNVVQLTADLALNNPEIEYLNDITITAAVENTGTMNFNGELAIVVYDMSFEVLDTIGVQSKTIASTDSYILFLTGTSEFTPGVYYFSLISRNAGANWQDVNANGFSNRCQLRITESKAECLLIYTCDFETPLMGWTFEQAEGVTSGFVVDTAVSYQGEKSLYTSADGGATMGYTATNSNGYVSIAYKKVYLEAGRYKFYHYTNGKLYQFEQNDSYCVRLVPISQKPQALNQYQYPGDGNSIFSGMSIGWYNHSSSFSVSQDGEYYLVFYLIKNKNNNGEQGVAIDNIKIQRETTLNIKYYESKQGIHITWDDIANVYDIYWYTDFRSPYQYHNDTSVINSYFIPFTQLRNTLYGSSNTYFKVSTRGTCNIEEGKWLPIYTNKFPNDTCPAVPTNFQYTNTEKELQLTWSGNSDSYEIGYYKYTYKTTCSSSTWITFLVNDTSCIIPYNPSYGLQEEGTSFYIRTLCDNDTSIWRNFSATPKSPKPTNLYTQQTPEGIFVTWSGNADRYEIECRSEDEYYKRGNKYSSNDSNRVNFFSTDSSYIIPYHVLPDTLYHIRVRALNENDTSFWTSFKTAYNVNFGEACIPFYDLCGPNTECTTGSYSSPYYYKGTIDYGFKDWDNSYYRGIWYEDGYRYGIKCNNYYRSRHTICFAGETDPRCDNLLTTVPPGEDYALRLGNWYNGEGESVTYTHTIDSGYKLILLLKYAVVLQDPSHSSVQNPHFTLEILDENNQLLDEECLYADFAADKNAEGWNNAINAGHEGDVEYQDVVWKDWTTIGINLSDLSQDGDRTIKIRLTTKDCTMGKHYGYAYFSLSCQTNEMLGVRCGERPLFFEVPEGFNYNWYLMDDPTKTPVWTERRFDVAENDTNCYYVDIISPENENCFYTMEAYTLPRLPQSVINYKHVPSSCTNHVQFTCDSSFVYKIMLDGSHEKDFRLDIDSIFWDFGEYGKSTSPNNNIVVPNEGDTFTVSLRTVTNNCDNIVQCTVEIPAIHDTTTYAHRFLCEGDTLIYSGKQYFAEGVYTDTLQRYTGCDSIHILTVEYLQAEHVYHTDSVCENDLPYIFFEEEYTTTGEYEYHLQSSIGCDTLVHHLSLTVLPELEITLGELGEYSIDEEEIELTYTINRGVYTGYQIEFSPNALNNGFVNQTSTDTTNHTIAIPIPDNAREGIYNANITFFNHECDNVVIPIEFKVYLYNKPISDATLEINPVNCNNEIIITNNSKTYRYYSQDEVVEDPSTPIDSVRWDFEAYGTSDEFEPALNIPSHGDTITVTLTTYVGNYSDTKEYTLEVPSIESPKHYMYANICEGEVYEYEGKSYTQEGEHITSVTPNKYGCDSTNILVISYIVPEIHEMVDSVCSEDLPYLFHGQECNSTGIYTHAVKAAGGCDSIVYTVDLLVFEEMDVQLEEIGEICGDDPSFTIRYVLNNGIFSQGNLMFGQLAQDAGFENIEFEMGTNQLQIEIPENVRPDFYDAELQFDVFGCRTTLLPVQFTVLYPSSVIGQRWNDFLSVKNADYNGGYTFTDYQWYLNDSPINAYKASQIYEAGKELDFEGEYRVLLTRADDGKTILSCPFTPIRINPEDYTDMNTYVFKNDVVTASSTSEAKAYMYTSTGKKMKEFVINKGDNNIQMPPASGIYILNIVYNSGNTQNIKIVVRD